MEDKIVLRAPHIEAWEFAVAAVLGLIVLPSYALWYTGEAIVNFLRGRPQKV